MTGYIRNAKTGEPVLNASVFTEDYKVGNLSDAYGHYSLTLSTGNHTLNVQVNGMKDRKLQVLVYSAGHLDVDMEDEVKVLKEVVVSGTKTSNIKGVQMGVERLNIRTIQKVPTVFGEGGCVKGHHEFAGSEDRW